MIINCRVERVIFSVGANTTVSDGGDSCEAGYVSSKL